MFSGILFNVLIPTVWTIAMLLHVIACYFLSTVHHYHHINLLIKYFYTDGLVQDCSNSSAIAIELLQSCTKPSISSLISLNYRKSYKTLQQLWYRLAWCCPAWGYIVADGLVPTLCPWNHTVLQTACQGVFLVTLIEQAGGKTGL